MFDGAWAVGAALAAVGLLGTTRAALDSSVATAAILRAAPAVDLPAVEPSRAP
jgi:hypothetical protein